MREIKFRAWDKKRGKMRWGDDNLQIALNGDKWWQYGYETNRIETEHQDDFILMQYTGLHDKNGKEIYEGDIIIGFCTGNYPAIVECDAPDGGYNIRELDGQYIDIDSNTSVKVIGNIYENPELLKT